MKPDVVVMRRQSYPLDVKHTRALRTTLVAYVHDFLAHRSTNFLETLGARFGDFRNASFAIFNSAARS
jgi:hypothetical protein